MTQQRESIERTKGTCHPIVSVGAFQLAQEIEINPIKDQDIQHDAEVKTEQNKIGFNEHVTHLKI